MIEKMYEDEVIAAGFLTKDGREIPPLPDFVKQQVEAYNATPGDLTDCPICKGKTYVQKAVYYPDVGYWSTIAQRCPCYLRHKNDVMIKRSGIKNLLKKCTFDTFEAKTDWQKVAKETAMNYKDGWFFIGGQSGRGKTHICIAILGRLIEQNIPVQYMPWTADSRELKSAIFDDEYSDKVKKYLNAEVLYIDDLFKTRFSDGQPNLNSVTDADIKIAFDILNHRYINNLRTLISSEFYLNEISNIDNAIGGRIYEMSEPGKQWINLGRGRDKNRRAQSTTHHL